MSRKFACLYLAVALLVSSIWIASADERDTVQQEVQYSAAVEALDAAGLTSRSSNVLPSGEGLALALELGLLEEDLKQGMGVDTEPVLGPYTVFGFPNEGWKEYRLDSGQEVLVSRHFNVTKDEKGDTYIYPRGDTTCEPSGHMPYGGYYFEMSVHSGQ